MTILGIDWAADMAAEFGGQLQTATFTHDVVGAYNEADPSGSPGRTPVAYAAEGLAVAYKGVLVDGERITKRDYRVMLMRGTIKLAGELANAVPAPQDTVSIPPPGKTTPVNGVVIAVEAVTEAFVTLQVRGPGNA